MQKGQKNSKLRNKRKTQTKNWNKSSDSTIDDKKEDPLRQEKHQIRFLHATKCLETVNSQRNCSDSISHAANE